MRDVKSFIPVFLTALLISGFSVACITRSSLAQSSASFKISGYILDSNGQGIASAMIIFNVPSIVPSVYSDSLGYYEIFAPAGTYRLTVWPPFDSNYIYYDEQGFVVESDITKNITLATGYKVSGYITDASGKPIVKAVVALNKYLCGWYSNYSGYYFVTAPAGTYTLGAKPANGPQDVSDFSPYFEYNVVVNGDLVKNITVESTVSTSNRTKISGFVLDANGNALAGADIIFCVPDIVPSVRTNQSGYYEIYAPADTYHLIVWPPFDSNYLPHDQPEFSVGSSDVIKNITLSSGYKLSGYLTDSTGAPIRGALASLDLFHCGWYSNSTGYYFVTAPAGTYNLMIQPKKGPTFSTYTENNFVLTGNTIRNFTLTTLGTAPAPTSNPESNSTLPSEPQVSVGGTSVTDDFSVDSGAWKYLGSAYRDPANKYLVLTTSANHQGGAVFYKAPIRGAFTVNFRYKSGGDDGFTLFFYKQEYSSLDDGGSEGFAVREGSVFKAVPGYGIEFDAWQNIPWDFQQVEGGQQNPQGDRSANHIALIKDFSGNHLAYVDDLRVDDDNWHQVSVCVQDSSVSVFVDQELVLQWTGVLDRTYEGFGFSGGTGSATGWHIIDDFSITSNNLQKPVLTASCGSSTSYAGFNVRIDGYLTLNETGISNASILLSYSVNGGKSWEDLTLVYTGSDGSYSATWLPSVTGNSLVKAIYEGDVDKLGASSEIVSLAVTNFAQEGILFSVSSNSTVTSLAFNSTTSVLSFTVSGPSETTGYVKVTIAKSLISNPENIKVYLDGKQLTYEVTSNPDSWLLSFMYAHSTHRVSIDLAAGIVGTAFLGIEYWTLVGGAIATVISTSLFYFKKRKR